MLWFRKHKFLLLLLIILGLMCYLYYSKSSNNLVGTGAPISSTSVVSAETASIQTQLFVDISGAVKKPGVYTLSGAARVVDALKAAAGFTENVNLSYVSEQLNLVEKLHDGQKIFIPFVFDEFNNVSYDLLCKSNTTSEETTGTPKVSASTIDVNIASKDELIALYGIGEVTAGKIISGRPYKDIDEFYAKIKLTTKTKETLLPILIVK